jgi:hypothetical protein
MFIRGKFVTNSSSTAFLCYGIEVKNEVDFIGRLWKNGGFTDEVKEKFALEYGEREYKNARTGKVIKEKLDLTKEEDLNELLGAIGSNHDMEEFMPPKFEWAYEVEMVCPIYFRASEGMIKEINLPNSETMADVEKRLEDFLEKLYPDVESRPRPKWILGEYYS